MNFKHRIKHRNRTIFHFRFVDVTLLLFNGSGRAAPTLTQSFKHPVYNVNNQLYCLDLTLAKLDGF